IVIGRVHVSAGVRDQRDLLTGPAKPVGPALGGQAEQLRHFFGTLAVIDVANPRRDPLAGRLFQLQAEVDEFHRSRSAMKSHISGKISAKQLVPTCSPPRSTRT